MNIDDVPLTLKIDTGPYVTVRSEKTFNTLPKVYNVIKGQSSSYISRPEAVNSEMSGKHQYCFDRL